MDPVKKIKDHIVALNDVSFEDDVRLERYLSTLRALLTRLFGSHSQYMTYLNSVRFHPVSAVAPLEEGVRSWAAAKKQVRDLLFVLLDDPVIRGYESWDEREIEQGASGTVAAAERIVQNAERQAACSRRKDVSASLGDVVRAFRNKVRVDMSFADQMNSHVFAERPREEDRPLPRVRIDLTQLDFLHDGVEPYLVHRSVYLPKNKFRKALVVLSSDLSLNQRVRGALAATELSLVETDQRSLLARGLSSREDGEPLWEAAILILSSSSQEMVSGDRAGRPFRELSVAASFQAGYLAARLGQGRVLLVFEGDEEAFRPSGPFDLRYIPVNPSGGWRNDLLSSLKGIGVKVKDEAQPFFYAG